MHAKALFKSADKVVIGNVVEANEFSINLDKSLAKNPMLLRMMLEMAQNSGKTITFNSNGIPVTNALQDVLNEFGIQIQPDPIQPNMGV